MRGKEGKRAERKGEMEKAEENGKEKKERRGKVTKERKEAQTA